MKAKKRTRAEPKGENIPLHEKPKRLPIISVRTREMRNRPKLFFAKENKSHLRFNRKLVS